MGRPELIEDPRFATNSARVANVDELDAVIEGWTSERTLEDVLAAFEAGEAAAAPVLDIEGILADPQYTERGTITRVRDDELGEVSLPEAQPRLSETPGGVRFAGGALGSANDEVFGELGLPPDELARLRSEGVV
jgi:crotonobetainyl-CoA:carnitine CoA-transferase CaiB-like acyl-CoA transferase